MEKNDYDCTIIGAEPGGLVDTGIRQISSFGAEFKRGQVASVRAENGFIVSTNITQHRAPHVIISAGVSENPLKIKEQHRFFSRTVFTCVDCDDYRTITF